MPPAEKESGTKLFQRIGTAYEILSNPIKRSAYDKNKDRPESSAENTSFEDSFEHYWEQFLKRTQDPKSSTIEASSAEQVISDIKFLIQSIVDKPQKKWIGGHRYKTVSMVANELMREISVLEKDLTGKRRPKNCYNNDIPSYTTADFQEFLLDIKIVVLDAQNKNEFNTHRGYIRTMPVLREITVMLQILVRFIGLCLYKIYDRKTPLYEDGLKHGLFTPPKTTTQQKIDILNSELKRYIDDTKPFTPYLDKDLVCFTTSEHTQFSESSSLRNWAKY